MLRGASLASLWLPFLVLTVMAVVVFTGATLRFRRDLAPGRRAQCPRRRTRTSSPGGRARHELLGAVRDRAVRRRARARRRVASRSSPARSWSSSAATGPARRRCCARWSASCVLDGRRRARARRPSGSATSPAAAGSWPALTVRQNMDFVGGIYGLSGERLERRREELLARAGLDRGGRPARLAALRRHAAQARLQHGHAARTATSWSSTSRRTGVDPVSRIDLWRLVSEAAAAGAAVLMSTTYLDEAERAGSLLVLDGGRTLAEGTLDEVRGALVGIDHRGGPSAPSRDGRGDEDGGSTSTGPSDEPSAAGRRTDRAGPRGRRGRAVVAAPAPDRGGAMSGRVRWCAPTAVSRSFGDVVAVDDVTHARRHRARWSGCSGPTAPGKTTLIRLLLGLLAGHAGRGRAARRTAGPRASPQRSATCRRASGSTATSP